MTGSTVPETEVLIEVKPTVEGVPESTVPPKTKAAPETVSVEDTASIIPEQTLDVGVTEVTTVEEANVESQAEAAGPDRNGVKGLPAGESGVTGNLLGRLLRFCMRKRRLNPSLVQN